MARARGAGEWRVRGVPVPVLGQDARIHPYYGVFSPVRGEYLDLVAQAPLSPDAVAWDIGTGTGVLAALLAHRRAAQVVATDVSEQALACARDNLTRLGMSDRVQVVRADLFPVGQADIIVCNPPWLPGRPTSAIEYGVYDPDSRMLKGFLQGLRSHLTERGEGWLILSDLAERLGKSRRVRQSIIRHAFRYFMGRNESLSDSKTLIDAEQVYVESKGSFDALVVSLLTSDSFVYR